MARFDPISYRGPVKEYKPTVGDYTSAAANKAVLTNANGYSDLGYLKQMLDLLIESATSTYSQSEAILSKYSLKVLDGSDLQKAQAIAYPEDSTPDYISFDEYKYLYVNNTSNSAQFIISAYENNIRGPGGSNALDISKIALYINNEAKRIKEFIDGYIGDLDDSSEQRTVELFQDWTQDATNNLKRFWEALQGQVASRLPQSELDQLTPETASQFQAVFHVKLNVINGKINDLIGQLEKNWETASKIFYDRYLGPALQFQLKVGRELRDSISVKDMPVLGNEAVGSVSSLDSHFTGVLTDQIKRNKLFVNLVTQVLVNMGQRDSYLIYLSQLSQLGKSLNNKFIDTSQIDQPQSLYESSHPLELGESTNDLDENFLPLHSSLVGLDADDAHPQYLLKSGGVVTGDIELDDNVKFGGIIPKLHKHNGIDGSEKISGDSIEYDTITVANVDSTNADTSTPTSLTVASQIPLVNGSGITNVTVQIAFDMENGIAAGYEFEIIELS